MLHERRRKLKYIVCVTQSPDTAELPKVTVDQAESGNQGLELITNPWDEYAIEEGLRLKEKQGGSVLAITVGPAGTEGALKSAVAMGVPKGVRVWDDAFAGSDALAIGRILAAAVRKEGDYDVVLTGKTTVDGNGALVPVALASALGAALLSQVAKIVAIGDGKITVERLVEEGREKVTADLPVVIAPVKEINEPRYASFMGIRKASRAKFDVWDAAALGINAGSVGAAGAKVAWGNLSKPPAREGSVVLMEGETVEEKVTKLVDALMAEKVI